MAAEMPIPAFTPLPISDEHLSPGEQPVVDGSGELGALATTTKLVEEKVETDVVEGGFEAGEAGVEDGVEYDEVFDTEDTEEVKSAVNCSGGGA